MSHTLSNEDRNLWLNYIENYFGMVLPKVQQNWLESRVCLAMQQQNLSSTAYLEHVKTHRLERQKLIDGLMILETRFFRHQHSYQFLAESLEQLSHNRLDTHNDTDSASSQVSLWSVGCSTGEEAWSLAITADQSSQAYKVLATDVSQFALTKAKEGIYPKSRLNNVSDEVLAVYFNEIETTYSAQYEIADRLRDKVAFLPYNLLSPTALAVRPVDFIFCQNVLIYFRQFDQRDILNRLAAKLKVGGCIVMAPGEGQHWRHPEMIKVNIPNLNAYKRIDTTI